MKSLAYASGWWLLLAAAATAADPLYQLRPYDEIKLDENNNSSLLRVQPLAFRKLPPAANRIDELEIELLERPGEKYKLPWANIAAVQFFEDLVLAEADPLVRGGKFDEAYPYFQFLETKYPKTTGLKEAIENYLYVQIGSLFRLNQDEQALALAVELHRRNPQKQGLAVAYERITLRLVAARLATENYAAARGLLKGLAQRYPGSQANIAPLEMQLQQKAAALLAEAQGHFTASRFAAAELSCRKLLEVWPTTAGAAEQAAAIREKYPVVSVGVTLPLTAPPATAASGIDWMNARTGRLLGPRGKTPATYTLADTSAGESRFAAKNGAIPAGSKQPREVVEQTFLDSAAALRALRRGEISIVERVSPWELKRLASAGQITVVPYGVPSVHLLVPNANRPLTASRKFRRGVLLATDREAILRRGLLDGQSIAGCEVLGGPFPKSIAPGDAYGSGHNDRVVPRPYDPGLAMPLFKLAEEESGAKPDGTLVLAHPAEPIARVACQSLARQLDFCGLKVALRELTPGQSAGDCDLLYVELVCRDPAADVWRILGPEGLVGGTSPAMLAELRQLERAADAKAAAAQLQSIQRLAAAELPVIPLWQLVEHAAVHSSLSGVGQRPASLYENVAAWQVGGGSE